MSAYISFDVDDNYILDLKDDTLMNEDLEMYDYIGKDPVKAFYLGFHLKEWFHDLDKYQQYLYSKQARHNQDDLEKYLDQIQFWSDKFSQGEEVVMIDLAEYVINNMFFDKETEEMDRIKLAFFFGSTIANKSKEQQEPAVQRNLLDNLRKDIEELLDYRNDEDSSVLH